MNYKIDKTIVRVFRPNPMAEIFPNEAKVIFSRVDRFDRQTDAIFDVR
jgi:hypothetical protein